MAFLRSLLLAAAAAQAAASRSPLIGIFSLPVSTYGGVTNDPCANQENCEVLPASYVRFIESAGGQVVPVSSRTSDEEIDHLVHSLNGFLFTGGGDDNLPRAAHRMLNHSKAMHKEGQSLPVWGTCLGFEWLIMHTAPGALQAGFQSENRSYNLNLTPNAPGSRLLGNAPSEVLKAMTHDRVTFNNHHEGITPEQFANFPSLVSTLKVLSTSFDDNNREFVSMVEGVDGLPWFGVQWHPEKNAFEHGLTPEGLPFEAIPHSAEAVAVEQYVANFFVNEARKNSRRFSNAVEEKYRLVYGKPISTDFWPEFEEVYAITYTPAAAGTVVV